MSQQFTCLSESLHARMISPVGITANLKRLLDQPKYRRQQGELAKRIGAKPSQLSDWKNGRYADLRISNIIALAKEFGVSVEDIIRGEDSQYDRVVRAIITRDEKVRNSLSAQLPSGVQGSTATSDSGGSGEYSAPTSHSSTVRTFADIGLEILAIAAGVETLDIASRLRRFAHEIAQAGADDSGARARESRLSRSRDHVHPAASRPSPKRARR